jgi:predicted DCC family thiol-disulfide oxidoreductase YuxK
MIPTAMPRDANRWVVLYDSDCGFCRWSLARLLAFDRDARLRPVALGTAEADALLADLDPEQRAASWHLVSPERRRWSAGAAAAPLLRLLPGGPLPAELLERAPRLTERAYRWVADHRSLFSRAIPASAKARADARIAQAAIRAGSFASR